MDMKWIDGFRIRVSSDGREAVISANREGLLSLAGHFAALAEGEPGDHFHLDAFNALEEGSAELIVERLE